MYCLLFAFWLILCGRVTGETIITGAILTALLGILAGSLFHYTPRREWRVLKKLPLFCCYVGVLMWEILKAALAVAGFIVSDKNVRKPALVTFRPAVSTDFGRFILANSITLTPGTITVEVKDGLFTVHCLSVEMLDTSSDGVFVRWIRRLEK